MTGSHIHAGRVYRDSESTQLHVKKLITNEIDYASVWRAADLLNKLSLRSSRIDEVPLSSQENHDMCESVYQIFQLLSHGIM